MDGVILIERFLNLLENNKKISTKLFKNIVNSEDIPKSIKKKVKKAYIKTGGVLPENEKDLPYYTCKLGHIIKNCGGMGCVYGYYPDCSSKKECKSVCPSNIDTVVKMMKGNIVSDIRFSIEKFIRICDENFGDFFIKNYTSFKKTRTEFNRDDIYSHMDMENNFFCYFLKLCDGDVNKLLFEDEIHQEIYIKTMFDNILTINGLGFIHGDIKFDNLLYKITRNLTDKNTNIYIHDFDSVFYFEEKNDILEPFPMFTPYCACPIYIFYRQFIKIKNRKGDGLQDFMYYLINNNFSMFLLFINGVIGTNVGSDIIFKYLCEKRDNVCGHIINIFLRKKIDEAYESENIKDEEMDEINKIIKDLKEKTISSNKHFNYLAYIYLIYLLYGDVGIKALIQYSDIFSLSMELLYNYFRTKNPLFFKLGYHYLTEYFYFPIQSKKEPLVGGAKTKINLDDIIDNYNEDKNDYKDDIDNYIMNNIDFTKVKSTCHVEFTDNYTSIKLEEID